jgi:signal transduction histidine kinase
MIAKRWKERWPAAVMALMPVIGLLAVGSLVRDLGRPYGGFLTQWSSTRFAWEVSPATPAWWPIFEKTGLRYGDVLLVLDGSPYGSAIASDSAESFEQAFSQGPFSVRIWILRDGYRIYDFRVEPRIFGWGDLLEVKVPDLIAGLCYWLLALGVFCARPGSPVNRLFGLAGSLVAGSIWAMVYSPFPDRIGPTLRVLWVLGGASFPFIGVAFFSLALVFPCPARRAPRRWIVGLTGCAILASVLSLTSMFLGWSRLPCKAVMQAASFLSWGVYVLGLAFFGARPLWLAARSRLSRRVRRQVWVLLAGVLPMVPLIGIDLARQFDGRSYFWMGLDQRWAALPVTICLAVIIVRYQNFERMPAGIWAVLVLAVSAGVASIGAWIFRLADPAAARALGPAAFLSLLAAALAGGLFWSFQAFWRGLFARLLHWDRIGYSAARRFGQEVVARTEAGRLPQSIASALVGQLELERAAIWLWDERLAGATLAAQAGEWPEPPPAILTPELLQMEKAGHPAALDGPASSAPFGHPPTVEVIAPLRAAGKPLGLLGLGRRWDDEVLTDRDLEIVDLIAQQSALFLLTAAQVEQLRQFPGQIAWIQERERFKIAQELHDTVQQFLGRLPFRLEVSRQAAATDPEEARSLLGTAIAEVASAAQTVRELRNDLAPLHLDKGLRRPLSLLIKRFRGRTGLEVEVELSPEVESALSPEARRALYRVVQQALDNVASHAQAKRVQVTVKAEASGVRFAIEDDGRGFSEGERSEAERRGSFGLESMKARITSLRGSFAVEGRPGVGTWVEGWLPGWS